MYPGAEPESEDKVDIWKAIFVYCLDDNGSTQCVAHVKVDNFFLGREVFLFSDTSWARSNDGDNNMNDDDDATDGDKLQDWMKVVSPANANYDPRYTVFMIAIGPIYESITGCVKLAKFDMRGQKDILDPSICRTTWDYISECLRPNYNLEDLSFQSYTPPTNMISTIKLGIEVSCMIHFKYPPNLNHLICIGSNQSDELSVYDWRFGIKVGALLWKSADQSTTHHILEDQQNNINNTPNLIEHQVNNNNNNNNNNMEDGNESDDQIEVQPWGLESTLVLPPHWSNTITSSKSLIQRGFRLIAVGDNRIGNSKNKLEIKVWDISYLLQVKWDPLKKPNIKIKDDNTQFPDLSHRFSWWKRAQKPLKKFVTQMIKEENKRNKRNRQHINNNNNNNKSHDAFCLPYSPPPGFQSMLLAHTFDKDESRVSDMPVKYTAYNVLHTSLFLLTEDGKVNVMDIETGKITRTVENIAATPIDIGPQRQIRGIDINVIGGREVVVTSKEGLLRGVVS
ncbi:hypothetical protein K501DRAFT_244493 [Backusella circina FSU 941]|nr:hypothetical protein K501DRAFT_244493 [Backusella circina FSU 941]